MHSETWCASQTKATDLLVSSMEKQVLFKRLCQRNAIRREIGIRPMDVPTIFKRKVKLMTDQRYADLLEPYLVAKFDAADWPVKFTARLLLAVKLHKAAVDQLYQEHGIADPRTTNPDIISMIGRLAPSAVVEAYILSVNSD
jgi:hypothetical protein